jgi:prepilin-type N-terminal cleavage/methylation domain-containing protein
VRERLQQGVTLLEMLIVLAVIGLVMSLGFYAIRAFSKTALRTDAVGVAAALRSAASMAAQSGLHHRVVLDLDQQVYRIEACPDPIRLRRGSDEDEKVDREAIQALVDKGESLEAARRVTQQMSSSVTGTLDELGGAESADQALQAAAALAGVRVGTARCGIAPGSGGNPANFADPQAPNLFSLSGKGQGVKIRRVYVQHLQGGASEGEVSVNFFPSGSAEKALVELADAEGTQFTVLVHGLTGRVEVRDGSVDPDRHMRRNAVGDRVEDK